MPETDRISVVPLSYQQLLRYLKADNIVEEELGLAFCGRTISEDVKDMVQTFTLPAMRQTSGSDYIYYTFWLVIEKKTSLIVAELGFKGPPDVYGNIEIGYGTMPGHRNKGYMTEAVGAMIGWAGRQENIRAVLAEVDETNLPSLRIVEKNGFVPFDKKGTMLWWKKTLKQ